MDTSTPLLDIGHVIQLSVAPVFLLSGIGIILTVLTNRLARVVDRARRLEEAARASTGESLEERRRELRVMAWRARLMNRAITLSTCSALLVALVVVLLFLGAFLDFNATLPVAGPLHPRDAVADWRPAAFPAGSVPGDPPNIGV